MRDADANLAAQTFGLLWDLIGSCLPQGGRFWLPYVPPQDVEIRHIPPTIVLE